LLVSNLAYMLMKTDRHKVVVPAAILLAIILLVGGQTILERILQLNTAISVVIEFIGGLMFIALVVKKVRR
jgi:iron complex transport system permease protein